MRKIYVGIVAVLFLLGLSGSASAISPIDWVLAPDNQLLDMAVGNTVLTGYNNIDFVSDGGSQPQGIFGAGFTMTGNSGGAYFDADLWTWDSYLEDVYWDAFVVNVNTADFYWNLALTDPISGSAP